MKTFLFTIMISILSLNLFSQNVEKRIALVIGNSNYIGENSLKNPVNDANLMASALTQLGFTVIKKTDVNRQQMTSAITSFWEKLGQYNVALFYFAGHGIAVNGVNYLLPIDAQMNDVASVELDAISVSSIVSKFDKFPSNTNILILDACRNNPFKDKRGSDRGFKAINPTKGTLIAFAAADGEFANDNPTGSNGLFTEKLVSQMKQPIMVEQVFKKTRSLVQQASNNSQNPMEWNMLNNDFYFIKEGTNAETITESKKQTVIIEEETLTGTLKITSNVDGSFFLDGTLKGNFSKGKIYTLKNIEVGQHNIKVGNVEKTAVVQANKTSEITVGEAYAFTETNNNTNSIAANLTIPTVGLVAYYPFNGNANDESGNGNNGTVYGAELTSDRFGNTNSAFRFRNRYHEILFPNYQTININRDFTINGWFKVEDPSGTEQLILHTLRPSGDQAGIGIAINYAGSGRRLVYFLGSNWKIALRSEGNNTPDFYIWHMFTLVKKGDSFYHYVDGNLDKIHRSNFQSNPNLFGFRIGSVDPNSQNPHSFKGCLDDYRIYTRALSEQEITTLFQN